MRLGMISQWYDPEVGSAAVPGSIARALSSRGHQVDVLTGVPNYPTGKVYPGYRVKPYHREQRDGIQVHRAPLYPSHDSRPLHRAANFLSFAAGASAVGMHVLRHAEAVLVYSTPATVAIPAMTLRALRRTPYVLLIQDMWPQTVTASGFMSTSSSGRAERALHRFCDATYRRAAAIAVTSPGMVELVTARGVDPRKISVVTNWADENHFRPVAFDARVSQEVGSRRRFTAMYAGSIGEVQGLEIVIEAATLLRDQRDIGFVLVGGGVAEDRLRRLVAQRELDNVRFAAPQPVERMAKVLAAGDVQIISLRDLPIFRSILPSKVQATLASGRPVIGAVSGDAADVIEASGAGTVVPPGSARALADEVLRASRESDQTRRSRGENGRDYYVRHLGEDVGATRLADLLTTATRRTAVTQ